MFTTYHPAAARALMLMALCRDDIPSLPSPYLVPADVINAHVLTYAIDAATTWVYTMGRDAQPSLPSVSLKTVLIVADSKQQDDDNEEEEEEIDTHDEDYDPTGIDLSAITTPYHVVFSESMSCCRHLGECSMRHATSVDLSGLHCVEDVGGLLFCSERLGHVDTSPMTSLVHVRDDFLRESSSVTSVDLSGLRNVTCIGDFFLFRCSALQSVDTAPLTNLYETADHFLSLMQNVTSLDLSGLCNLSSIGGRFAASNNSALSLDFSAMTNLVDIIGGGFGEDCGAVTSVDVSGLSKVTNVGGGFLSGTTSLPTLDLSGMINLEVIGRQSLTNSGLTALDLSVLKNLTRIEYCCLKGCNNLQIVDV
eukprot:PhM_4_TR10388/c0_g1_i1/m.25439